MQQEIYAAALKMLVRKNCFTSELEKKLLEKFPDAELSGVINQLKSDRYLDDERLFRNYVIWKAESGYGPYYIKEKLRQKGVDKSVKNITETLEAEEINTDELIIKLVNKYRRTGKKREPRAFHKACFTFLTGRGFAAGDCIRILNKEVDSDESDFFEGC